MQCLRCGAPLEEGFQVCKKCGYPVKPATNNVDIKIESVISEDTVTVQSVENKEVISNAPVVAEEKVEDLVDNVNDNTMSITNSNFEIFEPENNDYNDINIIGNEYSSQDVDSLGDDDYSDKDLSKYKYLIVTGVAAFIVVIALLCVKLIPVEENKKLNDNNVNNIVTYNKIVFKDYIFSIPDKYIYSFENDAMTIGDSDGSFGIQIELSNGDYNRLVSKKDEIKKILEKKGYTSNNCETKKENDIDFLVIEIGNKDENLLLAITEANSTNYFTISLFNKDKNIDYSLLKNASEIIKLVEEVKTTNKLSSKNLYGKDFETIAK